MLDIETIADLAKQGVELACVNDELVPVVFLDLEGDIEVVGITTPDLGNSEMEKALQIAGVTKLLHDKNVKPVSYTHLTLPTKA